MEIKYFETVLAVANNLSYYKTADQIHCSQSSVSRQIKKVEEELGTSLFKHVKGGKVELTAYGKAMMPVIHTILSNYKYMEDSALKIIEEGQSIFRLGIYRGPFNSKTRGRILYQNYLEHPEIVLNLSSVNKAEALEQLQAGELDAAILYDAFRTGQKEDLGIDPRYFNVRKMFLKYPCIAMAKDHPLAKGKSVSIRTLKYETFVVSAMLSRIGIQHDSFVDLCSSCGFEPKIRTLPVETYAETRDAAVASKGWMYPTFQTKSMGNDDIAFVPLEDPTYYCVFYVITPKETNKATDLIVDLLIRYLTKDDDTCVIIP